VTEWRQDGFLVTDDPARVDVDVVHSYLSTESYWATHRTREETAAALAASWCFSLIDESTGAVVGFARLVTDRVTYGWVADVFVITAMQGRGLGIFLMACVADAARGINRLQLGTRDAHGLYAKYGFTPHSYPERAMERLLRPLSPPA
jgi:GNAT superfamily N-acetyltransferase